MKLFPSQAVCCEADITRETSMITEVRGLPWQRKRAKRIFHIRLLGGTYPEGHEMAGVPIAERFWHWSDIPPDRISHVMGDEN